MNGSEVLDAALKWFQTNGGTIEEDSSDPTEVLFHDCQYFLGLMGLSEQVLDVACLLRVGDPDEQSNEYSQTLVTEIHGLFGDEVQLEVIQSEGFDVWSVLKVAVGRSDESSLETRLRGFVDNCAAAVDFIDRYESPVVVVGPESSSGAIAELRKLTGIKEILERVEELEALAKVARLRSDQGLASVAPPSHLVFTGNPGTGKTTVARLIGELYKELGLLPSGHLVEARPSDLIGTYLGQTAPKTEKVIKASLGGILFIDEAYSLIDRSGQGHSPYGEECIATLLLAMENRRGEFAVIIAGYTDEIKHFVSSNPGLRSRFDQFWHFRDYTDQELVEIFEFFVGRHDYRLGPGSAERALAVFSEMERGRHFGNARAARNLFHSSARQHARRMMGIRVPSAEDLSTLIPADIRDDRPAAVGERWSPYL
jgi:hypothetical protein